jgi:transposase-like protein
MAENEQGNEVEIQRWTAKRKAAVVLEVLKKQRTAVDACRKYGIKQSQLEDWTRNFLESGENALRSNPRDVHSEYEEKIRELQAKVGELVLERDVFKKKAEIEAREKNS